MPFLCSPYSPTYTLCCYFCNNNCKCTFQRHQNPSDLKREPLEFYFSNYNQENEVKKLVFLGDVLPQKLNSNNSFVPKIHEKFQHIFNEAERIILNCESVVDHGNTIGCFERTIAFKRINKPSFFEDLCKAMKIDNDKLILNIANNHSCDNGGPIGMTKSFRLLKEYKFKTLGYIEKSGDVPLIEIDLNNTKVGIMSYVFNINWSSRYNNVPLLFQDKLFDIPWSDIKKERNIDTIIAYPHWGHEGKYFPFLKEVNFTEEIFRRLPFDAIIGQGPHYLQPVQILNNQKLCFYSIGDFLTSSAGRWKKQLGVILEILIDTKQKSIVGYKLHPFFNDKATGSLIPIEEMANPRKKSSINRLLNLLFKI